MTQQEELADYLATGMKDYQRGIEIYKKFGCTNTEKAFFENVTDTNSKVRLNILRQKLNNVAKASNIKPKRSHEKTAPVELVPERPDIPVSKIENQNQFNRIDRLKTAIGEIISKIERKFKP